MSRLGAQIGSPLFIGGQNSQQNKGGETGEGDANSQKTEKTLSQQLSQKDEELVRMKFANDLMKDPDFAAVLRAKHNKQKVKIVSVDETGSELGQDGKPVKSGKTAGDDDTIIDDDIDFDSLGGDKKKIKAFVTKMIGATMAATRKEIAPIVEELKTTKQLLFNNEAEKARERVAKVAEQYPDFTHYGEQMQVLMERHPTLEAEDLYILAKARSGGFVEASNLADQFDSERPTNAPGRPGVTKSADASREGIRKGIREATQRFLTSNGQGLM